MQNSSFFEVSKLIIVMLAMVMLIGCSVGPVPPPPPQGPSGIITTPITSASAPFAITMNSSQTFTVSEAGYGGVFSFGGSEGFESGNGCGGPSTRSTESFSAPAGTSVTLSKSTVYFFGHCYIRGASYAVTVKDSLGNSTTIYTD